MDTHILEELQKARRLVVSLAKEVDVKNEKLFGMESKLDETFCMMMEEKAKLQQVQRAYSQGMLHFINSKFVSKFKFHLLQSYLFLPYRIMHMHSKNWMCWIHAFLVAACLCYITYNMFILSYL